MLFGPGRDHSDLAIAVRVRKDTLIRGLLFGSGRDHSDPGLADHCDLALAVEFWQALV